jgi:hypothetical protein
MRIINSGDILVKRRLIEGNKLKSKRCFKRVLAYFFNYLQMISLHAIYIRRLLDLFPFSNNNAFFKLLQSYFFLL